MSEEFIWLSAYAGTVDEWGRISLRPITREEMLAGAHKAARCTDKTWKTSQDLPGVYFKYPIKELDTDVTTKNPTS